MKKEEFDKILDEIKYKNIVNNIKFADTSHYIVLSEGTDFLKGLYIYS